MLYWRVLLVPEIELKQCPEVRHCRLARGSPCFSNIDRTGIVHADRWTQYCLKKVFEEMEPSKWVAWRVDSFDRSSLSRSSDIGAYISLENNISQDGDCCISIQALY